MISGNGNLIASPALSVDHAVLHLDEKLVYPLGVPGSNMFITSDSDRLEASSVLGWISIACWIIVYSPQILENYRLKSGEGLSVGFVVIWLLGDIFNLVGGLMAGLIPTVIIVAVYYTICDVILLFQIYYYRWTHPVHPAALFLPRPPPNPNDIGSRPDEHSPLLRDQLPNNSASAQTVDNDVHGTFSRRALRYALLFGFVIGTGVVAWAINRLVHPRDGSEPIPPREDEVLEWRSQVLGYASAILYSKQLAHKSKTDTFIYTVKSWFKDTTNITVKNRETKCEGLSLALFMFAIAGNLTYILSICVVSNSSQHILANASWLAGSGLTIFLDFISVGDNDQTPINSVRAVPPPPAQAPPTAPALLTYYNISHIAYLKPEGSPRLLRSWPVMFPININFVPGRVWHAFILLLFSCLYCAFILAVLVVALSLQYHVNTPINTTTSHPTATLRRGKRNSVERSLELSPFHPNAPAQLEYISPIELLTQSLAKAFNKLTAFCQTLFGIVPIAEILRRLAHMASVRGPLNTRLNRGIAQISTLRDQVAANRVAVFRYLHSTILLSLFFVAIVATIGLSLEFILLLCSGGLVLVAASDAGAGEEDGSNLVPRRTRGGIFAALFGQVGDP
ncbi:PQ-loop protein, partial [Rhizoctonia solani]